MVIAKSREEIARMARAGALVAAALEAVTAAVRPGVSTAELDRVAEDVIVAGGGVPSFKGYHGFPATLCTSPDDVVVHGIPSPDVTLREGTVVSIDCGAIVEGFHGDSALTLIVGGPDAVAPEVVQLVDATREALWAGLAQVVAGNHLGDVGHAIESRAVAAGLGVVRGYVGHGIGRSLHEDPAVPNVGRPGRGYAMREGWVLAVEPMCTLGGAATRTRADGWTVATADGSLAAHWEHTIAITDDGPVVLTARSDEPSTPTGAR